MSNVSSHLGDMAPELEPILRRVGWYPNRRVDDAQVEEWLRIGVRDYGFHIFPEAVRVLREYGDLLFGTLHISPEGSYVGSAMRHNKLEWLDWEWRNKEILFPIAYQLDEIDTYALSSTGKVYCRGVCEFFCANSFEEFLLNMCNQAGWVEQTTASWTPEMRRELIQIYNTVYANNDDSSI